MTPIRSSAFGRAEWAEATPGPAFPKGQQRNDTITNRGSLKRWFAGQIHVEKPAILIYSLLLKICNMC